MSPAPRDGLQDGRPALPAPICLLEAEHVGFAHAGGVLFEPEGQGLSFCIGPGLSFVRGGEQRGKTTLLRLMAGMLAPTSGVIRCHARSCYFEHPADAAHDRAKAGDWLAARRATRPDWDERAQQRLVEAFGLAEHIDKPMYMLSTGSRRKVGLVGAAAARAELTLLDAPFAALDKASCRVLTDLLAEAAAQDRCAWVLADYELPDGLDAARLAARIDLGE